MESPQKAVETFLLGCLLYLLGTIISNVGQAEYKSFIWRQK